MSNFIQLHFLTAFPAANLNRDDTGAPKTVMFGGATRLRISSQSLKRAWRTSEVFSEQLKKHIGIRTCRIATEAAKIMMDGGVDQKTAVKWAAEIANKLGKAKKDKDSSSLVNTETEQLVHISPEEMEKVRVLAKRLSEEKREPTEEELAIFQNKNHAVDIALFGRMLASSPKFNVEAACQVAHAIGVSASVIEDDFFTAIDDLKQEADDAGAGHLGETAFGSAVFYNYICLDFDLLVKNLDGDEPLAKKAVIALVEAALTTPPTGKQNSFGSRGYALWALAEKGEFQPRTLAAAVCHPISGNNMISDAITRLETFRENLNSVYGQQTAFRKFDVTKPSGSMSELLEFVGQ